LRYVIDASVAAKLFIDEEYSDKAVELIEACIRGYLTLLVPTLIVYELGNVFWKHPQITAEKACMFLKSFLDLGITLVDVSSDYDLLKETCSISKSEDLTFYDAAYIAMARRNETRLITADEKICERIPDVAMLLRDFKAAFSGTDGR
jgi:predicted nucleic acid-binding protein